MKGLPHSIRPLAAYGVVEFAGREVELVLMLLHGDHHDRTASQYEDRSLPMGLYSSSEGRWSWS